MDPPVLPFFHDALSSMTMGERAEFTITTPPPGSSSIGSVSGSSSINSSNSSPNDEEATTTSPSAESRQVAATPAQVYTCDVTMIDWLAVSEVTEDGRVVKKVLRRPKAGGERAFALDLIRFHFRLWALDGDDDQLHLHSPQTSAPRNLGSGDGEGERGDMVELEDDTEAADEDSDEEYFSIVQFLVGHSP